MLIKSRTTNFLSFCLMILLLTACATKGKNDTLAEIIHLTFADDKPQASVHNPQSVGDVTVSTIAPEEPLITVESEDGLPPDSEIIIGLPSTKEVKVTQSHKVLQGDTLYSIAKQYNKDYETLAIINKLDGNYTIYIGQTLQLDTSGAVIKAPEPQKPEIESASKVAPKSETANDTTLDDGVKVYSDRKAGSKDGLSWIWPVLGKPKVLRPFSNDQGENIKGIDIDGEEGDKVLATSDGIVVYAGDELGGYGNLVIVSHGERHISAYAHNQQILVKEEQKVRQGQEIALIGSTGTDKTKLFFQIRKDSQPMDPIIYLPKR